MKAGHVCIDASFALRLLLPGELSSDVETLWRGWVDGGAEVLAPPLFFAEVNSVLRAGVYFGRLSAKEGEERFETFMAMSVRSVDPAGLQHRAWSLAKRYDRPKSYDAQYLALAALLGCDLWTGDRRLSNAVNVPWLKWVGDVPPQGPSSP